MNRSLCRFAWCVAILLVVAGSWSCAPKWVYEYTRAENLAKMRSRPILLFYRDPLDSQSGTMLDRLESSAISQLTEGMVKLSLVCNYEPHRKYVAQYGITSAPGLAVIHPDGTYHCLAGAATIEGIKQFLSEAKPPGFPAKVNIQVPRPPDYLVRAEGTYDKAMSKASSQNRKVFIVYKWWLDGDSTELIRRLQRPELAAKCTETVNCVLDWDYVPNRRHVAKYGVTRFPALIVVHQDGRYDVRQGLASTAEIARFLSRALTED